MDAILPIKLLNGNAFPHDVNQHITERGSWVHKDTFALIVERFIRIFTIDNILINLENADV